MNQISLGIQISEARAKKGITQAELAEQCRLNIRTIQRIESGSVIPRFYTIKIINEVLGTNFETNINTNFSSDQLNHFQAKFQKRKRIRIITFSMAMILLLFVFFSLVINFPSKEVLGMSKMQWAPWFYVIMFIHLIGIGINWRCPGCNALLGNVFNTHYCSKCGLKFEKHR